MAQAPQQQQNEENTPSGQQNEEKPVEKPKEKEQNQAEAIKFIKEKLQSSFDEQR